MTILIPSYEPDERLLNLVHQLLEHENTSIVVVDDGSGANYSHIFNALRASGCTLLTHSINKGKGRALKTGFEYLRSIGSEDSIVCADSDGQHLPVDIQRVHDYVSEHNNQIVLGSRHFTGYIPARSRFGNVVTRSVYKITTGINIQDTQTGLRGYSASMLDWLCHIPGERFEYEMNMLLSARKEGFLIHEIPINTVYLNDNQSSHFRPLIDSAKIYLPIVVFSASSLSSAFIDFLLLILIQWLTSNLFIAVAGARICSSIFNYSMNHRYVFDKDGKRAINHSLPRYFTLVFLIMMLNYGLIYLLNGRIGISLVTAKLLTEGALFLFSFWSQRRFVY